MFLLHILTASLMLKMYGWALFNMFCIIWSYQPPLIACACVINNYGPHDSRFASYIACLLYEEISLVWLYRLIKKTDQWLNNLLGTHFVQFSWNWIHSLHSISFSFFAILSVFSCFEFLVFMCVIFQRNCILASMSWWICI